MATRGSGSAGDGRRTARPSVWIDGLEVNDRNAPEVRRRVGLVFQDPDDQLFCNTVIEDVAFGPLNLGMTPAEARRIARDCLERVDLRGRGRAGRRITSASASGSASAWRASWRAIPRSWCSTSRPPTSTPAGAGGSSS